MPEEGFKTITVSEQVYIQLQELAEKNSRSIPKEIEHLLKNRKHEGA
jgi:predicted CopG family antitoxin